MNDDLDSTTINRVLRRIKRDAAEEYEGEERRADSRQSINYLAWLPLALAVLAGVAAYVERGAELTALKESHQELKGQFVNWNTSISGRVRALEIGQ